MRRQTMADNMWRSHLLASLFLVLGTADLMLLNVWLVSAICPPSDDPISTATATDVPERTPGVKETPAEGRTAERVSRNGLGDELANGAGTRRVADVTSRSAAAEAESQGPNGTLLQTTGEPSESPAETVEPQQVAEVASDLSDIAAEPEMKVESPAESAVPEAAAEVEPIPVSRDSGKTERSSTEPRYRALHHAVVQFFFDGDILKPAARDILAETVRVYREHPDAEIRIDGHTDIHGSEDYNYRLSEQRARMIAALLEAEGVPSGRIQVRGHGPSQPLDTRNNAAASAKNRRVEITIRSRLP